jgi:arginyl-tRNA synthetase
MSHTTLRAKLEDQMQVALFGLFKSGVLQGESPKSIRLTPSKQKGHGHYASNIALALAKKVGKKPREIAALVQESLGDAQGLLAKTEIAGPGFLNLFVADATWHECLGDIIKSGPQYLRSNIGEGRSVLLEYVSANPTGPLHVAHGRGAIAGDMIARLLDAAGYRVGREYYVNDLGHQVDVFARSIYLRYTELLGRSFEAPEDFYPGAYVQEIASDLHARYGDIYLDQLEVVWLDLFRAEGVALMLKRIKNDLEKFGVHFDHFVSEKELTDKVGLAELVSRLEDAGHVDVRDGKKWFRSSELGDDKDRVIVRDDGRTTYFTSDIAYHDDKLKRGYDTLINVWGADHGGYIARVKAGIQALGYPGDPLEVLSLQMVSLSRGGEAVRMGKRLGTAIWLSDVLAEAGRDATRYFFAMRRCDSQMDFDIELATKRSLDNPVFYAQMGHARLCSIERKAEAAGIKLPNLEPGALKALILPEEIELIAGMSRAPDVVAQAAIDREPHQVVHYLQELIAQFHSYYSQYGRSEKVVSDDATKTKARLLLCKGLKIILSTLLVDLLGVGAPEEMYLDENMKREV